MGVRVWACTLSYLQRGSAPLPASMHVPLSVCTPGPHVRSCCCRYSSPCPNPRPLHLPCPCPAPVPPCFCPTSLSLLPRSFNFQPPFFSHHTPCCPAAVPFPFPPFLAPFPFPITTHLIHTHTLERYLRPLTASEKLVGFYSTGPKIRGADLLVDELFRRYHANPVFVIIDVRADVEGMPVQAYHSVEEVRENGKETVREFKHITSEIGAYEAEEVGVETLLRDINDPSVSSLAAQVRHKISSLKGLAQRLEEIQVREK